jgi:hypothetical protein
MFLCLNRKKFLKMLANIAFDIYFCLAKRYWICLCHVQIDKVMRRIVIAEVAPSTLRSTSQG